MEFIDQIHEYLPTIITFTFLNGVGLISPGPDFAMVVRSSLIYSRRSALLTALGIAVGITVHITYITLGVGLIISKNYWLMMGLKSLGAGYLIYLGVRGIMSKKNEINLGNVDQHKDVSRLKAFTFGFWTNVLNVKAMLFFLSLFTVFIANDTPFEILFLLGVIAFISTVIWFTIVALFFSSNYLRTIYGSIGHWIDRILGACLAGLGLKLLL